MKTVTKTARRVAAQLTGDNPRCPNCGERVIDHADNACVLNAFIGVLRDRRNLSEDRLEQLHANCSVDALWDQIGPILDDLEAGKFEQRGGV